MRGMDRTTADEIMAAIGAYKAGQFDTTTRKAAQMLEAEPTNWLAWHIAAISAARLHENRVAIDLFNMALETMPRPNVANTITKESDIRYNLGRVLQLEGFTREALRHYDRCVELDPTHGSAWGNMGNAWLELGKPYRAIQCYNRALQTHAPSANAKFNRAFASLVQGDLERGLDDYEARWGMVEHLDKCARPDITSPTWDGEPTTGTLYLHAEQGRGDQLMIARYIPAVQRRVGRLILEMLPELCDLFAHNFPGLEIHPRPDDKDRSPDLIPPHDVNLPTMSLLYTLKERRATISGKPYLTAPAVQVLPDKAPGEFRAGIAWAGSRLFPDDRKRSTELRAWLPVLRVPGVSWYSLQIGDREAEGLAQVPDIPIVSASTWRGVDASATSADVPFGHSAAMFTELDLIISVDTATLHLAGALGVPTWALLPPAPDWRWFLDDTTTPWYDSLRLFRAKKPMQWDEVIRRVRGSLIAEVNARKAMAA